MTTPVVIETCRNGNPIRPPAAAPAGGLIRLRPRPNPGGLIRPRPRPKPAA